jgi:thiamine-monophosphate kinase
VSKVKKNPTSKNESAQKLGERAIIRLMRNHFETMPNVVVPFGDDISAVPGTIVDGEVAILKTDMLVGRTDVPCEMNIWQAARKAVVMNVSDFAAKGVQPKAVLVSLGLPANFMSSDLEELATGLNAGAREYGAYVVGGDTGEACDLIISIHIYGSAEKKGLMLRSGAKAGDILAVTGFFGKSAAGLRLLLDDKLKSSETLYDGLVNSVLMPKACLKEGLALQRLGAVTASMDSSDGLAWCLHELGQESDVGFVVDCLPVAEEVRHFAEVNEIDLSELVLYGGEEYELVVTVNPKMWSEAQHALESLGGKLLPIGKATRNKHIVLDVNGVK